MKAFRQHSVRRDGLDLRLHVHDGEGPLVFFQHGLCGDAAQPAAVFPENVGARLAVLECRGHGQSPGGPPEAFSIATFAEDVAAAVAQISTAPCVVGGISMGAAIAIRLACTRPELVSGLVVARPAWTVSAAPQNMIPNLAVGRLLQMPASPHELEDFLTSETGTMLASQAPDNLASLKGFFSRQPRAVTAELLTRISVDGPGVTWDQLRSIGVPTLVIGHAEDVIHPLAHAQDIAAAIPGARLLEIPPKARDKTAYEVAFRAGLAHFLQEILHEPSRSRLV